jgi:prepilin-type N-terminal cleavage/methylation domain-containing protein
LGGASRPAASVRRAVAFTLIELLTVIAIISVLAGLLVGLAPVATTRIREARLKGELNDLVTAIEAYKAKYGVYPPDSYNADKNEVDAVVNPLYYELTGLVVVNNGDSGYFETVDDATRFLPATAQQYFHRDGFLNAATRDRFRRLFRHTFKASQHAGVLRTAGVGAKNAQVLTVGFAVDATGKKNSGFAWPLNDARYPQPVPTNPGLNPWRYVSTNPTNNPGTFDLWAEVIVHGQKKIYGNWKQ